jgi:single-strand DNA-binding protein
MSALPESATSKAAIPEPGCAHPRPADMAIDVNLAVIAGTLSSDPVERILPSGDLVVNYEVTCKFADVSHTVPVAWFAPPKRRAKLRKGDVVVLTGCVRRRFFRSGGVTASRTEVVAVKVSRRSSDVLANAALLIVSAADSLEQTAANQL